MKSICGNAFLCYAGITATMATKRSHYHAMFCCKTAANAAKATTTIRTEPIAAFSAIAQDPAEIRSRNRLITSNASHGSPDGQ